MRNLIIALCFCASLLSAAPSEKIDAKKALFGTGKVFVGAEIGLGSAWYPDVNVGVVAGYQHYFKESWQFYKFRHGVRGYGNLAYVYDNARFDKKTYHNHGFHFRVGADWTLEFNPLDSVIWGVYTGVSVGMIYLSPRYNMWDLGANFAGAWHIGGSANINNTHRFDVGFEGGLFSIFSVRYLYMF